MSSSADASARAQDDNSGVMRSRNVSGNAADVSAPLRRVVSAPLRSQLTAVRPVDACAAGFLRGRVAVLRAGPPGRGTDHVLLRPGRPPRVQQRPGGARSDLRRPGNTKILGAQTHFWAGEVSRIPARRSSDEPSTSVGASGSRSVNFLILIRSCVCIETPPLDRPTICRPAWRRPSSA